MPSVDEEDLIHRRDRCCIHRISADRPGDVDKDADLARCLSLGRRVAASWLVDPSSEHPKILVVLSPVPPETSALVAQPVPAVRRWQDYGSEALLIAAIVSSVLVMAMFWRIS